MVSFKYKLALYFGLLALLPLAAGFVGFRAVVGRGEERLADARLQAALRAVVAAFDVELEAASRAAGRLARDPSFQRALARRDREVLARMLASRAVRVDAERGFRVGSAPALAAERQIAVLGSGSGGRLGVVIASVRLDGALARRLRVRAGLESEEVVVVLHGSRVAGASVRGRGALRLPRGPTATVVYGGERYRAASARAPGATPVALAVLSPQARIDAATEATDRGLLAAFLFTLVLVVAVAYLEGRSLVLTVRSLVQGARAIAGGRLHERVPVRGRDELALLARTFNEMAAQLEARLEELEAERTRLREATFRFGEVLASTHDMNQLRCAIVETIAEATRASGAVLIGPEGEVWRVGDPDASGERIELPLTPGRHASYGVLQLTAPSFDEDGRVAAVLLAGQAVIALEQARLHRVIEKQALVDELTGLANRRRAESVLGLELRRAIRYGNSLAVVLTDLDDFKQVNDAHGHQAGDDVLRAFGHVLSTGLREFDLAGRWGGEEFVVVLPGTDAEGGRFVAERLRQALAERTVLTPAGVPLQVTASFGVAAVPPAATAEEVVAAADAALYAAKRLGKNRVEVAAPAVPAT